ncbi:MAG: tRNA-(ms[2]io[6]A)-hydroxylase [Gammaproteobacteria bacterium]|nr:tRNA-(ms[2]io[6]A)-hydroxylase [Gammaproteobacteria bacterium]MDH4254239.1 tRNA-(ms[2]io[6]A)-hydroxylase [Gammaproteobacteria bacterium]MDH5311401.1 tRNA-(ms[2]io[6]A)-hydroxylase [Gammaproteobacteria bacterium]
MAVAAALPGPLDGFFETATPEAWLDAACRRLPELLLDHASCELKAASTALGFIYRYPENTALCIRMSKLAREELRHFEQVRKLMQGMNISFERLGASRYAGALRDQVRQHEPYRLLDMLLVGALIEARSCERFAALAPRLPQPLAGFYSGLLASEARHFGNYLEFARGATGIGAEEFERRLAELKDAEAELICAPDHEFRFHSGPPVAA